MGEVTLPTTGIVLHVGPFVAGAAALREVLADSVDLVDRTDLVVADESTARAVIDELGGDDVHVVTSLAGMAAALPAAWQAHLQQRGVLAYADWLSTVFDPDSDEATRRAFWDAHDLARTHQVWSALVGVDRFTAFVCGDETAGPAMGAGGAELLRAVNRAGASEWDENEYDLLIRRGLVDRLALLGSGADEPMPALPAAILEAASRHAVTQEEFIAEHDVRVAGDVSRLRVLVGDAPAELAAMPGAMPITYAASAINGVQGQATERWRRLDRKRKRELRTLRRRHQPGEGRDDASRSSLRAVVGRAIRRLRGAQEG